MALYPFRRSGFDSSKKIPGLPLALLVGVVLLAAGCHPAVTDPNDPKFIVVEKGDWHLTQGQVDEKMAAFLKQKNLTPEQAGKDNMLKLETWTIKNMVLEKLLLDRATTAQLPDVEKDEAAELDKIKGAAGDLEFAQQLKSIGLTLDDVKTQIHEKVLISKLLEKEADQNIDPTEQEIDEVYLKNKEAFNIPPKIRVSRVLIHVDDTTSAADKAAKKKAIDQARARVAKGEDFSKVAMEVSEDRSSAPRGGDIGFFQRNENEAQFDDVAFNTKVGVLSPVFETPLGYQFLKVTATQPAGVVPVADARAYIADKLRQVKKGNQEEAYTTNLLAKSDVTYHVVMVDLSAPPPAQAPAPDSPATNAAAPH